MTDYSGLDDTDRWYTLAERKLEGAKQVKEELGIDVGISKLFSAVMKERAQAEYARSRSRL